MKLPAPELYIYKSSPDHHGQPKNDCNHLYFFLPSSFWKIPGKVFCWDWRRRSYHDLKSPSNTHMRQFISFSSDTLLKSKTTRQLHLDNGLERVDETIFFFGQKRRHVSNDNSLLSSIYQSLAVWLKYYVTDTRKRHLLIFQPICKQHCPFFFANLILFFSLTHTHTALYTKTFLLIW